METIGSANQVPEKTQSPNPEIVASQAHTFRPGRSEIHPIITSCTRGIMQSPRYEDLGHIPYEGFCYVVSVVYLICDEPGRCTFLGFPGSTIDSMHGTGQKYTAIRIQPGTLSL